MAMGGTNRRAMSSQPNPGNRVLVVAREAATRSFIQRTLESVLLEVVTSSRFENAIAKLRSGPFGVLVVDPTMPSVDGVDFLREVGRRDPSLARRTVIVIERGSSLLERLEAFPFSRRIDRPVVRQQLILAVSECLRESSERP
jgi:DNA-binding NtrC family response regulator